MGTKLSKVPTTEKELNELLQNIYQTAKNKYELRQECNFTGILEVIASEPNIVSAVHKIKSNKGSRTPGVDEKVIDDCLHLPYDELLEMVRRKLKDYHPDKVRRAWTR